MFSKRLKKILEIAKRTGDRVVVLDSDSPDNSFVVMGIDRYLSSGEAGENNLDTIAESENGEKDDEDEDEKKPENREENESQENLTEEDLTDRINQEISMWKNQDKSSTLSEEDKVKKSWKIPPAIKNKARNIE